MYFLLYDIIFKCVQNCHSNWRTCSEKKRQRNVKRNCNTQAKEEGSFPAPLKSLHENMKGHMLDRLLLLLLPVTLMMTLITVTMNLLSKNGWLIKLCNLNTNAIKEVLWNMQEIFWSLIEEILLLMLLTLTLLIL